MNGKVIKLNDYKFNFGQETIFLNVFAVFKSIKNGNKYIIYSYDNKKLYCGSAFVKNNEIIVMISKGENDDDIKKFVAVGDEVYVLILDIDDEEKKLKVSIKDIYYLSCDDENKIVETRRGFLPLKDMLPVWIKEKMNEYEKKKNS